MSAADLKGFLAEARDRHLVLPPEWQEVLLPFTEHFIFGIGGNVVLVGPTLERVIQFLLLASEYGFDHHRLLSFVAPREQKDKAWMSPLSALVAKPVTLGQWLLESGVDMSGLFE